MIDAGSGGGSFAAAERIGRELRGSDLRHVFVLSDGLNVNGTELVEGLERELGSEITITGGLAGDGSHFETTAVGLDGALGPGCIAAVGLYRFMRARAAH